MKTMNAAVTIAADAHASRLPMSRVYADRRLTRRGRDQLRATVRAVLVRHPFVGDDCGMNATRDGRRLLRRICNVKVTAAILLTLVVAGCGGAGSQTKSSAESVISTSDSVATSAPQSSKKPWRTLVTLNHLGTFKWRCTESPGNLEQFSSVFMAEVHSATDRVSLSINDAPPTTRWMQPGQHWVTPLQEIEFQTWRIAQATEPQTISAVVRIEPTRCAYGVPITDVHYGTSQFNSAAPF
jgi:hypothetical protein